MSERARRACNPRLQGAALARRKAVSRSPDRKKKTLGALAPIHFEATVDRKALSGYVIGVI
jgi:hypothetical protein